MLPSILKSIVSGTLNQILPFNKTYATSVWPIPVANAPIAPVVFVWESPPTYTSPGRTSASSWDNVWQIPYWPRPYLKCFSIPNFFTKFCTNTIFWAASLSTEGTKWSSDTHTLLGSHIFSIFLPFFSKSLNIVITPGPETSWSMTLSTLANITSPDDTLSLPDARASIFSVIVIPKIYRHIQCNNTGLKCFVI